MFWFYVNVISHLPPSHLPNQGASNGGLTVSATLWLCLLPYSWVWSSWLRWTCSQSHVKEFKRNLDSSVEKYLFIWLSVYPLVIRGTEDVESKRLSKRHSLVYLKWKTTFFHVNFFFLSTWRNLLNPGLDFSKSLYISDCSVLQGTSSLIFKSIFIEL